jgi:hypothetical protein
MAWGDPGDAERRYNEAGGAKGAQQRADAVGRAMRAQDRAARDGARHARARPAPAAAAKDRAAQRQTRASRGPRRRGRGRAAHDAAWFAAGRVTARRGAQPGTSHLLAAELLAGAVIVAIRALGDYQLTDEGTQRGTLNTPANGGYGPFTVLSGLVASFFALSFLAAGGGKRAKAATAFGALIIVVLMIKSMDEITIVGKFITASPATRTVTAADWSAGASQSWGTAWQVSSSATSSLPVSSSLAAYGAPYTAAAAVAGGTAASNGTAPSGGTTNVPVVQPGPPRQ